MPKKQSSSWYVAATHVLTAGFAVPFIGGILVVLVLSFLSISNPLIFQGLADIANLVLIALGTWYSARYVNRTYQISNPKSVITFALIYFIIVRLGLFFWQTWGTTLDQMDPVGLAWTIVMFVAGVGVFYFVSKKLITANT